ncbi:MAG: TonB-dependent receptor, partial [Desulfobacterales bacterium]|nr:TonB-dependent receptor [Desulfobacterales bacterium]
MPSFYHRYWAYSDWRQWQLNLVGEHKFTDALKVKTRLFYVNHSDGIMDVSWDAEHTTGGKKWFEESYYDDSSIGGEIQALMNMGQRNSLRFGLNYMKDNHKEGNYLSDDCWDVLKGSASVGWTPEEEYAAHTYTFAVEDEFRPFNRFSVVLGLSYDAFEPTQTSDQPAPGQMDIVNPQVGMTFDMTDATRFHVSVGQKSRFPSLKELYSTYGGGNPDLDPEKALAYEAGASHIFSENVTGKAAFFYHNVDDLIDSTKLDGESVYININEATIYGAEATVGMQLSRAFHTDLNYTYLTTADKSNNDRELEGRPRHRVNLALTYRCAFGLTLNMQASYTKRQYWENDNYEWTKLPDYFLINAKLTQKLKKIGGIDAEVFLQGTNILDEDYYETNGPEPGFNLLAGISLRM